MYHTSFEHAEYGFMLHLEKWAYIVLELIIF